MVSEDHGREEEEWLVKSGDQRVGGRASRKWTSGAEEAQELPLALAMCKSWATLTSAVLATEAGLEKGK